MKSILHLVLLATALVATQSVAHSATLTPVTYFDGAASEFPESICKDAKGNLYLSMVFGGKIKQVTPAGVQSDFAYIADNWLLGMTFDQSGNLVVLGASGIWKVSPNGTPWLFSSVPGHNFLNDLVFDHQGNLYVTDSTNYSIWKVNKNGVATVWCADPLLLGVSGGLFPFPLGPNGIRFDSEHHTLNVVVTSTGRVLQIDVKRDGSAGTPRLLAESQDLVGADGIEVDEHGNIYIAVNIQDRIAKVTPGGDITDVVVDDILATPTALVFGKGRDSRTLYVCNNGNVFFSSTPFGEGLLKLALSKSHRGKECSGDRD